MKIADFRVRAGEREDVVRIGYAGSARGDWGPGSDVDLIVLVEVRIPAKWTSDSRWRGPPVPEEVDRAFRGMRARSRSEATLG